VSVPVVCARTLEEALAALEGATPETRLLAGGTDLVVEMGTGRTAPDRVVDVWRVDALRGIGDERGGLLLGALTTCTDLLRSELARARADVLVAAAGECGAVQIQNRATLGGNLGTASPAADLVPALMALEARVRLLSAEGVRELPVADAVTGYRATVRRPDELIESFFIPPRPPGERRAFRKVGTRAAQSISKVVVAVALELDAGGERVAAVRGAAGAVAPRTVLLPALGRELVGERPDLASIARAAHAAATEDVAPIDDVRSTVAYRRLVLRNVLRTLLASLADLHPPASRSFDSRTN
jgi:CO/xanthine dehydrogenase FAD-binding subunit